MSKNRVWFQTIQFSISAQFKYKYSLIVKKILFQAIQFNQTVLIHTIQFSLSIQLILFNPSIVALGAMAMKGYSAFSKAPASLEPHNLIV